MKIAIVHDFLMKLGGAERVVKLLMDEFPEAPVFTLLYDKDKVGDVFPEERVRTSILHNYPGFIRKRYQFLAGKMPRAIEEMDLSDFDVVISSSGAYSHGAMTNLNTKHVCYCHSPMRYAWDWTHEYRKEKGLTGLKSLLVTPLIKKLREWDFIASDRPDVYLANSKHVAKRLEKYYGQKSEVVYPPVDVNRFRVRKGHSNYFLIASTLTAYKRIDLAVQLFNKIGRKLVIIGDGSERAYLENIAGENIEFLGFVDDEVLKEYFENCRAFVFPGEDDFGIAPVEAMACGKPVLAYGKGGATETVVAGKTGEFFYEDTVDAMEDALARLLHNEEFYKADEIRKRAEKFSQEMFIKKIKQKIK